MEKGILFNTEMVKAILEGRKTTTRRIIKGAEGLDFIGVGIELKEIENTAAFGCGSFDDIVNAKVEKHVKAQYLPGDILYVRETWAVCDALTLCSPSGCNIEHQLKENCVWYRADGEQENTATKVGEHLIGRGRWRPSIHMPRVAARIFLKVADVRIERLQDINYDNLISEGTEMPRFATEEALKTNFKSLWDSTLKKEQLEMYGWNENPYVWVISFERYEKPDE